MNAKFFISIFLFTLLYYAKGRASSNTGYEPLRYNTFDKIELRLTDIAIELPDFTKLESIGNTFAKNDIWQLTFSKNRLAKNPIIWIDCGMQARDWITHSTCMYIIDSITNYLLGEEVTDGMEYLLTYFDMVITPVVNPDGYIKSWTQYNRAWAKNTNPGSQCDGVYISQNFDFKFGAAYSNYNQCDEDYIGPSANSEAETKAIIQSLEVLDESNGIFALFHMESRGQKWVYPWSYTTISSPSSQALVKFCEAGVSAVKQITSRDYQCDQAADVDKIRGGTFLDYVHAKIGILTLYTLALRSGNPGSEYDVPEEEIEDTGREVFGGILAAVEYKKRQIDCLTDIFGASEYKQFDKIEEHLKCIADLMESKVKLDTIGKTIENNDIWQVTFSKNFTLKRDIVWIDCGMQGRDWITHSTCIYIIDAVIIHFLDEKDSLIDNLLDVYDLAVIPVVNPDGYIKSWTSSNRHWTKNTNEDGGICNGVLISQNFPFMFGLPYSNVYECDLDYIGLQPNSELETNALENNLKTLQDRIFMVFHLESSGQKWMYPWSYKKAPSQFVSCLENNCKSGVESILKETGKLYTCHQMSSGEGTSKGGTFVDFVHNDLEISLVYSLALRAGEYIAYDVPDNEISVTGNEILQGILTSVENAINEPCTIQPTMKPLPTTPGPSGD